MGLCAVLIYAPRRWQAGAGLVGVLNGARGA
jgi:hypothetical protein